MATRGWEKVGRPSRGAKTGSGTRSKFNAVKTVVDGVTFASKAEARRYGQLKVLQASGLIFGHLVLQPVYRIYVKPLGKDPIIVGKYVGDFQYEAADGTKVVEDVKGFKTPVYRLKKKLVEALYGIEIREIPA